MKFLQRWQILAAILLLTAASANCHRIARAESQAHESTPANLQEAVEALDRILGPERKQEIRSLAASDLWREHFGLAGLIRNRWLVGLGSPLREYFARAGIEHGDNMSAIVVRAYWLHLHQREVDADQLIGEMLESIQAMGNPFGTPCPDDPDELLEGIFDETLVGSGGQVQSRTVYSKCPTTGSLWVFESRNKQWRPANDSDQQRIREHQDRKRRERSEIHPDS